MIEHLGLAKDFQRADHVIVRLHLSPCKQDLHDRADIAGSNKEPQKEQANAFVDTYRIFSSIAVKRLLSQETLFSVVLYLFRALLFTL